MSWLPWVRARRRRLRETPLSEAQRAIVRRNVPLAERLPAPDAAHHEALIQLFLDHKRFEGLGGLAITDEIRVTVAAQACLLLLGLGVDLPYPELSVVRVYPDAYRAPATDRDGAVVVEGSSHRLGESSHHGYVVLAWGPALRSGRRADDGQNLVLHEFAHQLDAQDGRSDGAPLLQTAAQYGPWATALGDAFDDLRRDVAARRRNVLDGYGATNPAEFFAVATETFFERPRALRAEHPDLYAVLAAFYRQDPALAPGVADPDG